MKSVETSVDVRFSEQMARKVPNLPLFPETTLVKYDPPEIQAFKKHGRFVSQKPLPKKPISLSKSQAMLTQNYCAAVTTNVDGDSLFNESELRQLLENLYPPIEWKESNTILTQTVSVAKGSKEDILSLADSIRDVIEPSGWQKFNISDRNQSMLLQALDEIIRQIIVEKPLEGILLRQSRDHLSKSLEIRRSLFASNTAFSIRKELQLTQKIENMKAKHERNKEIKTELRQRIASLIDEREATELKHRESLEMDYEDFQVEIQSLTSEKRRLIQQLKHLANLVQ